MDNDFILILYLQQGLPHQRQDDLRYIDEMLRQNLIDHMKRNVGNFLLCLLHVNLFGILRVSQRFLRLGIGIQDCLFFFFLSLRYSLGMTSGKAFIVTGLAGILADNLCLLFGILKHGVMLLLRFPAHRLTLCLRIREHLPGLFLLGHDLSYESCLRLFIHPGIFFRILRFRRRRWR